jgi:hypothetical protein
MMIYIAAVTTSADTRNTNGCEKNGNNAPFEVQESANFVSGVRWIVA